MTMKLFKHGDTPQRRTTIMEGIDEGDVQMRLKLAGLDVTDLSEVKGENGERLWRVVCRTAEQADHLRQVIP